MTIFAYDAIKKGYNLNTAIKAELLDKMVKNGLKERQLFSVFRFSFPKRNLYGTFLQIYADICEHLHVEILDKYLRETNAQKRIRRRSVEYT